MVYLVPCIQSVCFIEVYLRFCCCPSSIHPCSNSCTLVLVSLPSRVISKAYPVVLSAIWLQPVIHSLSEALNVLFGGKWFFNQLV